jgi:hypothetical protein
MWFSCSSLSSTSIPHLVISEAGESPAVGILLSSVFAHSAVVTLVAKIKVDRALVLVGV